MKKVFAKQIGLLLTVFLLMSTMLVPAVGAEGGVDVLFPPVETLGAERILSGQDIDAIAAGFSAEELTAGATATGKGYETYYNPYTYNTAVTGGLTIAYEPGTENAVLIPVKSTQTSDGKEVTTSMFDTRTNGAAAGSIHKYEVKLKLSAATDDVLALQVIKQAMGNAGRTILGVYFDSGNVIVNDNGHADSKRTMALAEEIQGDVWYKVVRYVDLSVAGTVSHRVLIYRVDGETEILIGDTGAAFLNCAEASPGDLQNATINGSSYKVGNAVISSTGDVLFDDFAGYNVTSLADAGGVTLDTNSASWDFYFTETMDAATLDTEKITLNAAGTVEADFTAGENKLTVSVSDLAYETDYTLTLGAGAMTSISDNASNAYTVSFTTGADPMDPYRPQLTLPENEILSDRILSAKSVDAVAAGFSAEQLAEGAVPSGTGYQFDHNPSTWGSAVSGSLQIAYEPGTENAVLVPVKNASSNTAMIYSRLSGGTQPGAVGSVHKYEVKVKLSDASDKVLALQTINQAFPNAGRTSTGVYFNAGSVVVRSNSADVTMDLTEAIAAGTWYKVVRYVDLSASDVVKHRVLLYKVANGAEVLIGDTGAAFVDCSTGVGKGDLYAIADINGNSYSVANGIISSAGDVLFDDFNAYNFLGNSVALSDNTSIEPGTVAFDFSEAMDALTLDKTCVTLATGEGEDVALTDVDYDETANQLVVTFPTLEFETEYVLTVGAGVMKTAEYGLAMKKDKAFSFTTTGDPLEVVSMTILNQVGNKAYNETNNKIFSSTTAVKASVKLKNTYSAGGECLIILAVYDAKGNLSGVKTAELTVQNTPEEGSTRYVGNVALDYSNLSKVSVMVWKSWEDITPRTTQFTITK